MDNHETVQELNRKYEILGIQIKYGEMSKAIKLAKSIAELSYRAKYGYSVNDCVEDNGNG